MHVTILSSEVQYSYITCEKDAGSFHQVHHTGGPVCVGTAGPVSQLQDITGSVYQLPRKVLREANRNHIPHQTNYVIPLSQKFRGEPHNNVDPVTQPQNNHTHNRSAVTSAWQHLNTSLFEMSTNETKALEDLLDILCMYQLQKHVFSNQEEQDKSGIILDLHEYMIFTQSSDVEKSKLCIYEY